MEQLEQFKRLASFQKELDYQLKKCDEFTKSLEKDYKQVVNEIEQHFELCMNLLASRKATLLKEANNKLLDQRKNLEATTETLQISVDSSALIMKTGIAVYQTSQSAAEHVWEGAKHLSCPKAVPVKMSVSFPSGLSKTLENYGEVLNSQIQQSTSQTLKDMSDGSSSSRAKLESVGRFRFLMLGNPKVGKTSILQKFVNGNFSVNYSCTTVLHHMENAITINSKPIILDIVDVPGSERHKTNAFFGLKGMDGVIFVYDITDYNSLSSIPSWLGEIAKLGLSAVPKILVGNKTDLFRSRAVDFNLAQKFATERGLRLIETSAKDNKNIQEVFLHIASQIVPK